MMKKQGFVSVLLIVLALAAYTGCDTSDSSKGNPPKDLSYATTDAYYDACTAIDANVPTVTGTVTSWSVSPALPGGLALDPETGIISGTPDGDYASQEYTVTASNKDGHASAVIAIRVFNLSYDGSVKVYKATVAIPDLSPTIECGTATGFTVDPALPDGIDIDAANGVISGTPTGTQSRVDYTFTATLSGGGTTSYVMGIIVNPYTCFCEDIGGYCHIIASSPCLDGYLMWNGWGCNGGAAVGCCVPTGTCEGVGGQCVGASDSCPSGYTEAAVEDSGCTKCCLPDAAP